MFNRNELDVVFYLTMRIIQPLKSVKEMQRKASPKEGKVNSSPIRPLKQLFARSAKTHL